MIYMGQLLTQYTPVTQEIVLSTLLLTSEIIICVGNDYLYRTPLSQRRWLLSAPRCCLRQRVRRGPWHRPCHCSLCWPRCKHTHTHTHTCIHIHLHACACLCVCVLCVYMYTHIIVGAFVFCVRMCVCADVYANMYADMYADALAQCTVFRV
jgi:hypothetical protein